MTQEKKFILKYEGSNDIEAERFEVIIGPIEEFYGGHEPMLSIVSIRTKRPSAYVVGGDISQNKYIKDYFHITGHYIPPLIKENIYLFSYTGKLRIECYAVAGFEGGELKEFRDITSGFSVRKWVKNELETLQDKCDKLEKDCSEWRIKFNDKNRENEDYKEKYEKVQEELDTLKNERINENRENSAKIISKERENSTLRSENTRLRERLESSNAKVIDLSRRLENSGNQNQQKDNEIERLKLRLDQGREEIRVLEVQLANLRVENEREKGEKNAEVREKDSELKRKEEEIKRSQKQAKQSREELLSERVNLKYGKLEIFANQIGINLQQVDSLCRYCERLVQAQKNFNQANVETHEINIARVREGLRQNGVQIEDIQKFCRKCEKVAQIRFELNEIRRQQPQHEARQELPPHNNRINHIIIE